LIMGTKVQQVRERARQSQDRLNDAAKGRELELAVPQWRRAERTEPLSRPERELVLRWQFFNNCVAAIESIGVNASDAANEAFAAAYLRTDDEIGPVMIVVNPGKTDVVFGEGVDRALKPNEKATVDRFLDAFEAYGAHLRKTAN
jgi:hypothetical protein